MGSICASLGDAGKDSDWVVSNAARLVTREGCSQEWPSVEGKTSDDEVESGVLVQPDWKGCVNSHVQGKHQHTEAEAI